MTKCSKLIKIKTFQQNQFWTPFLFSTADRLIFRTFAKINADSFSHNAKRQVVQKCAISVVKGVLKYFEF